MIDNIIDLTVDALKSIKRNVWVALSAIATTAIMLSLVGIFVGTISNTNKLSTDIENGIRINVYLNVDSTDAKETITVEGQPAQPNGDYRKIYNAIMANKVVEDISYSSKDDQLKQLTTNVSKTWAIFDNDSNPLHDVYMVKLNDASKLKETVEEFKKIQGVEKVEYGEELAKQLFKVAKTVKLFGTIFITLLVVSAIFLISNTIRIAISGRKEEIKVMRLVGATNNYIRMPFLIEGAIIGFVGSILPIAIVQWLYVTAVNSYKPVLAIEGLEMISPMSFLGTLSFVTLSIGMIVGVVGSLISMQKYMKI